VYHGTATAFHNRAYITIRIHKHNNKVHNFAKLTEAYKTYNHIYNDKKMEPKEYKRM